MASRVFKGGAAIDIEYRPSPEELVGETDREKRTHALREAMDRHRNTEIAARRALLGPQRDDLEILLDGRRAASFGSAGEKRRIAFVFVVATVELATEIGGAPSVLLIDDVEAEFDDERLEYVLSFAAQVSQTLVATSKAGVAERYASLGRVFTVKDGQIR